jgi:hypothetical protein
LNETGKVKKGKKTNKGNGAGLPKKKRVQTLDDIRREYNKGIGDFKNFGEYQDYMAARDQQI